MKLVTINTDASFNKGVGAYAYWIETPTQTIKDSGLLDSSIQDPTTAELYGFEKALHRAYDEVGEDDDIYFTAFCDNLFVVRILNGQTDIAESYPWIEESQIRMAQMVMRQIPPHRIKAHYVKPHKIRVITEPERANLWCDFHAKEMVRRELRKIKAEIDFGKI